MTRGAPLEADAILLSSQAHREHDLFLRAFVRGPLDFLHALGL